MHNPSLRKVRKFNICSQVGCICHRRAWRRCCGVQVGGQFTGEPREQAVCDKLPVALESIQMNMERGIDREMPLRL
jgi:hypothetical protein